MRIRSAFVTGAATVVAVSAVATVVLATTPAAASPGLVRLLWLAVFLAAWGCAATLLLVVRQPIARAIWVGLWPAVGGLILLLLLRHGVLSRGLMIGVVLATLSVSVFTWRKLRRVAVSD